MLTKSVSKRCPAIIFTPEFEEALLHAVEEDTSTRTRNIAGRLNVDHQTVCRVLHEIQLQPYHPQKV